MFGGGGLLEVWVGRDWIRSVSGGQTFGKEKNPYKEEGVICLVRAGFMAQPFLFSVFYASLPPYWFMAAEDKFLVSASFQSFHFFPY